ncbi:MAG: L,D-transpeptidase family protein [Alphaproteobacteria bacterium]
MVGKFVGRSRHYVGRSRHFVGGLALVATLLAGAAAQGQTQIGDEGLVDNDREKPITEIAVSEAGTDELAPQDPLLAAIYVRIEFDEGVLSGNDRDTRLIRLYEFYDGRLYAPVWVDENGLNQKAQDFVQILLRAQEHGLNPADYGAQTIALLTSVRSVSGLADVEIRLSKALLEFGRDLSVGRVEPSSIAKDIRIFPEGPGADAILADVARAGTDINEFVAGLAPESPNYARLKQTLADYRALAAQGGWTKVPPGEVLKPGMTSPRVAILRARLTESGDFQPGATGDNALYDEGLAAAVKRFQARHGLEVDAIVGAGTLGALNVSVEQRIDQMGLNMERRRWMADDLGQHYVFVNLADFELKVVRDGKTVHTARVVAGKPFFRTPVFSKNMTYMVVNPYWNVPPSIARKELLPKLQRDPGALQAQNIRILANWSANARQVDPYSVDWSQYSTKRNIPFKLRQEPGNKNALGRVKFMFPNKFNVYLHDTPSKNLFSRAVRSFSHGCIRVQNPLDFAAVLLKTQPDWTPNRLARVVDEGRRRVVRLKKPIPVHLTYLTAWVNKDGSVNFRSDIYGRDKTLDSFLAQSHTQSS